jgi:hypothetical protein
LEEINEIFGDDVAVHMTHISDEEKAKLDAAIGINNGIPTPDSQNGGVFEEQEARSVHVE